VEKGEKLKKIIRKTGSSREEGEGRGLTKFELFCQKDFSHYAKLLWNDGLGIEGRGEFGG